MLTVILFLLILSLLVIVHEFGHFITARIFGMKVYEFGMGFPPRALGIYKDPATGKWVRVKGRGKESMQATVGGEERQEEYPTTLYSLNWLPIGGFVKIKGENGEAGAEADSFSYHKAWKRLVVLVAGVTMNFILAAILLGIGFMIGLPTDVSGDIPDGAILKGKPQVVVEQVVSDSPADTAGVKFGDVILSINGEAITSPKMLTEYVASHVNETLSITIRRDEKEQTLSMTPGIVKKGDTTPRLGVQLAHLGIVQFPWFVAIGKGFSAAWFGLVNIFITFFLLIKNLVTGQGLIFQVSGPVGIASVVGESARLGLNYLINVTAMISLSLAALNILPIPALDGGRALFVVIERLTGRKVPMQYEQLAHTIGFVLLMILIVVVTARDIFGLVG